MDKDHSLLLTHHIKPDYGFYIQGDDRLYVAAYSSVASLVVRFSGYFLSANGEVRQYALDVAPSSDRAVTAQQQSFGEGFLLSCVAHLLSGNANRGQCYVRARIQRGTGATIVPMVGVVGGYVTDDYSPSFPYGKIQGPLEGPGYIRGISGTNPAPAVAITETVPTGARWRLFSVQFDLATDSNAANRYIQISLYHTTFGFAAVVSTQAQVASTSVGYHAALHMDRAYSAALATVTLPLPAVMLPAGGEIDIFPDAFQAGDNLSAPQLWLEEWIEA